jgi:outer membrane protein assembly factor BamD
LKADYLMAMNPGAAAAAPHPAPSAPITDEGAPAMATPPPPAGGAPPMLSDVPTAGSTAGEGDTGTMSVAEPARPSSDVGNSGASMGVEILTPGIAGSGVSSGSGAASSLPAATGAPDPNNGLHAVGPKDTSALPPIEKPAPAPDQINDVAGVPQPPAPAAPAAKGKKKTKAPAEDKYDESSSKKKPKKGLDKLNPF